MDRKTGEVVKPSKTSWDSPGGIQSKALTQFRKCNSYAKRVHSDVLQRNLARLDAALSRFYKGLGGYPTFKRAHQFTSFAYKPTEFDRRDRKHRISKVYLPFIGWMRFHDSRSMEGLKRGSVTITKKVDGWYMSVLVTVPDDVPQLPMADVKGAKGVDLGINQLASFSDGSFAENPRFATNKATRRRLRIRHRRVSRKAKGSRNRAKAAVEVSKLHRKATQKRDSYLWKVANQAHRKVDAVVVEDLNVRGLSSGEINRRYYRGTLGK